jgi:hypothetical protein
MLLRANANRSDLVPSLADLLQALPNCRSGSLDPDFGILFLMPRRQTFNRAVTFLGEGKHFARLDVED